MSDPRKTQDDLDRRAFERWLVDSRFVLDYPICKIPVHSDQQRYLTNQIGLMWRAWRAGQFSPHAVSGPLVCIGCGDFIGPELHHIAMKVVGAPFSHLPGLDGDPF